MLTSRFDHTLTSSRHPEIHTVPYWQCFHLVALHGHKYMDGMHGSPKFSLSSSDGSPGKLQMPSIRSLRRVLPVGTPTVALLPQPSPSERVPFDPTHAAFKRSSVLSLISHDARTEFNANTLFQGFNPVLFPVHSVDSSLSESGIQRSLQTQTPRQLGADTVTGLYLIYPAPSLAMPWDLQVVDSMLTSRFDHTLTSSSHPEIRTVPY